MAINKTDLLIKTQETRNALGEDDHSPMDIFSLVQQIDKLTIVKYPMGDRLSGMCVKGNYNNIIVINSKNTLGRQRFSLAHELYHLYYDDNMTAICLNSIGSGNDIEKSADQFATYFLIPPVTLQQKIKETKRLSVTHQLNIDDVVNLEQYFGVSRQAILSRLISENEIDQSFAETMKTNVIQSAVSLGYSDELYRPSPENKQYMTNGYLIKQINEAYNKDLISNGKYEELLLQAFRSDLVFGYDDERGETFD